MAGRTDTDYGLVPVKSRVSLSSRPVPPSYNKGRESNLTKQDFYDLFLSRCKLRAFYGIVNGGKRRLTDEEYRICMLTRLGFSVTEISLLTGQTVKVLATKRARLLKKIFGIEGGAETFDQRIREIFADATD